MPISPLARHAVAIVSLFGLISLAGCGEEKKAATQVAAKVNQEEISVHQINNVLSRSGNLPPEQVKLASRQVLERLVDQELLVQKAVEKKLDRDPKAMQAIEAARRDILARFYMESVTSAAAKPTPAEIGEFYSKRPELFAERRLYSLQEMSIAANPAELLPRLQEQMAKAKNLGDIASWLKSQNIPFAGNATTKAAEQLPLELLPRFHQMKDGQIAVLPTKDGLQVVQLLASRAAPMDLKAATPYVEQFLMNQKKGEVSNREIKQLREQARIEFVGEFAKTDAPVAVVAKPVADKPVDKSPTAMEKGVAGLK